MFNLPEKKSSKWFTIFGVVFAVNLICLAFSRYILGQELTAQNIFGFGTISLVISLFILPGYFGFQTYSLAVLLGDLSGLGYLFYMILTRHNDGWVDLTSVLGFISLTVIGIITGVLAQIVIFILSRKK